MPETRHVESEKNWIERMLSRMIREPCLPKRTANLIHEAQY